MKKKYIVKLASIEIVRESDFISEEAIENMKKTIDVEMPKIENGEINKIWVEDGMILAEIKLRETFD